MNLSPQTLFALGLTVLSAGFLGYFLLAQVLGRLSVGQAKALLSPKTVPWTPSRILLGLGIAAGFLAFLGGTFQMGFLLLLATFFAWLALEKGPAWLAHFHTRRKLDQMNDLFPQTLGMMIQALKTGQTIPQALEYLSHEAPPPLNLEFSLVFAEIDLGSSAEEALSKMAQRFPDFQAFDQFLESYRISRQTGANLTHLLQVLLEGMDEKNRILRKMDSMTAQARLSGLMMALLPFFLGFVFYLMDPDLMTPLFTEKAGWGILTAVAFLEAVSFIWIRQLLQLEV